MILRIYKLLNAVFICIILVTLSSCNFTPTARVIINPEDRIKTEEEPIEEESEEEIVSTSRDYSFLNFDSGEEDLVVHFMDVGQGDGIFIEFPDGKKMLMDGGSLIFSPAGFMQTYLSKLKMTNRKIDYMMLTHPDKDHCNGLDTMIKKYTVSTFYTPKLVPSQVDSNSYTDYYEKMMEEGAEIIYNINVLEITGENYVFTMYCQAEAYYDNINPDSDKNLQNGMSPISVLEYAGRKIVFTGDANTDTENYIMSTLETLNIDKMDCDVLKVGHHGSKTSTSNEFVEFITPEFAVISVGEIDIVHPQQEILDRLSEHNIETYRTDTNGCIVLQVMNNGSMNFFLEKDIILA